MQSRFNAEVRSTLLAILFIAGLAAALFVLPYQYRTEANSQKGLFQRTTVAEQGLPNYDIRDDANVKNEDALRMIQEFREKAGKNESLVNGLRGDFVMGENALRNRVPTLKVEYNQDIRIPEVIATDQWKGRTFLTGRGNPAGKKHAGQLIDFLQENTSLIGVPAEQIAQLKVAADYTNPNGILSFVELNQEINGVPVFRGEVKAGFTQDGEIIRVINNLAPGIDPSTVSTDFKNPVDAVRSAAENLKFKLSSADTTPNGAASNDLKVRFGNGGDFDVTAEKMYFPTEPGVVRPSWRVLIWEPVNAYYVITDAETGTVLWRKNIANDQTQSATYNVYASTTSLGKAMNSPAPGIPAPTDPTPHFQANAGVRSNVSLIGNEGNLSFNNLGWMTDGTNGVNGTTDGNAVIAGLDIDGVNGVDANGKADGTARVFNFAYTPSFITGNAPPPTGVEGGDPLTGPAYRNGSTTNLFYLTNRYHDQLYLNGFTEAARNFQNDNFGRGGNAADKVSAEVQDSSGTNNANFATPADGTSGRMQMYVFTNGTAPARDGSLDSDVVFHELTHGTSNRLIGNGSGLTSNRAGSSGEGWGDLYGTLLNLTPSVPVNSVLVTGGYVTYKCCGATTFTDNYFYGIRRLPYAPISYTGGPSNLPFNNLTLSDLTATTANSAFACSTLIVCPGTATEVHNAGEIWAVTGVEVWGRIATRLGPGNAVTAANRTLQLYTDGMKLSPLNPTYIQSRDAVISAAAALPLSPETSNDVADVREGFRLRGMGFSATDTGSAVSEAFDTPNVIAVDPFSISDSVGDNDGFPEPGEPVLVTVPVRNPNTGAAISNVQVNINGGPNVAYGTINDGATVSNQIPFTIPPGTVCGSSLTLTFNVSSSAGTQVPTTKSFQIGVPVGGAPVTFSSTTTITIPGTGTGPGASAPYGTTVTASGLTGNKLITLTLNGLSHTYPADIDMLLVGPGGQKFIPMSDVGGTTDAVNFTTVLTDSAAANLPAGDANINGTFKPTNNTAGDTFTAPAPAAPYLSPAPVGTDTFATSFGSDGTTMNGTWTLYVMDDAGVDTGTMTGWSLTFGGNDYTCAYSAIPRSRADYDGDGKSDLAVFRPSSGDWYAQRSTAGFQAIHWGATGDVLVPGDYDGDLKADWAVWRPTDTPNLPDFFVLNSNGFTFGGYSHGLITDIPVPGDFDGDGKADIVVWRPSTGVWYIWGSQTGTTTSAQFGSPGDQPMALDKDGDGKANLTVYRPSDRTFYMANATGTPAQNFTSVQWGDAGDILTPADYDGDNKEDPAVFRPSTGVWIIYKSTGGVDYITFGSNGDVPVPGDYDGDGKDDVAVYRNGVWHLRQSTAGYSALAFGTATDTPVERRYLP